MNISEIAHYNFQIKGNSEKIEDLYKKTKIYKKLIAKGKNPKDEKELLYIVFNNNEKFKKARVGYIHLYGYMGATIVSNTNQYICTVYGQTLLEVLKKILIILDLKSKEND